MKVSELFPRKYAVGADLEGKPVTLTISRVVIETMRPNPQADDQRKAVIYFKGATKGIILSSKKLAYQIAEIAGTEEMNDWPGTQVVLYPVPMQVAGKDRIAIRARAPEPRPEPAPASLQEDEARTERIIDPETGEILEDGAE